MKKLFLFGFFWSACLQAQTFPVNNLTVAGTSTFTGLATFLSSPIAPTPTTGDSSTKAATTAFVGTAITNAVGAFAPLVSPGFSGIPTAPTAALGTNTTQLATTAFVVQHSACADILDYGGNNTDSADNHAAWTASLAAQATSNQKCVYFPRGFYRFFNTPIVYNTDGTSITIKGDGQNVSLLVWDAGTAGGISIQSASGSITSHIRDLTVATNGTNTGSGIFMGTSGTGGPTPQEQSDIENVTVRGADGYSQTDYWQYGITVSGWSQVNFYGVYVSAGSNFSGTGVFLTSSNPPNGIVYNFTSCTFNFVGTGILYGPNIQGVAVHQSNFDTNIGISVPGSESGLDQLVVTASQFGINSGSGINVQSSIPNIQLLGNLFIVPGTSTGVILNNTGLFAVVGNSFNEGAGATAVNGISVNNTPGALPGLITGNIFDGMVGGSGIALFSGSNHVNVQSNVYSGNGTNVSNGGTSNTIGGGSQ
jgi:hypothetical protein